MEDNKIAANSEDVVVENIAHDEENGYAADADAAMDPDLPKPQGEPTAAEEQVEKSVLKTPIFIGCKDPNVVERMKTSFSDNFELCVMTQDILQRSEQNWLLSKMENVERQRVEQMRFASDKRAQALELVAELMQTFGNGFAEGKSFKHYDLKNYFNKERSLRTNGKYRNLNFSNRDIRNLFDTLAIFGFISTADMEMNFEKRNYYITVQDTDRIVILNMARQKMEHEKAAIELLLLDINEEIGDLHQRIENDNQIEATEEPQKPVKKVAKQRKADNDKGKAAETTDNTSKRKRSTKPKNGDS